MQPSFTFKDRVKVACLQHCIQQGLNEEEIIQTLKTATTSMKNEQVKTALLGITPSRMYYGGRAGLLGAALLFAGTTIGSGLIGNLAGRTAKNVEVGRLPAAEELQLTDEIAAYDKTNEDIQRRMANDEEERARRNKASVRRLF